MTCRAPTSTTTCAGTPTGAQLTYDNEGRLSGWQNAPSSPTTTDSFLYDGEGNRVAQQVTVGGSITTTTTYVAGGLEEITAGSSGTTLTKYFTGASGLPTAERVGTGGPLTYLATDGQGTVSVSLDGSGSVTSEQLYDPYGNGRYTSGTSPTSLGYTGQRADASTGLDYYNARYFDPVAGQFTSADSVNDGLNLFSYVKDNPETFTDPTGHNFYALYGGSSDDDHGNQRLGGVKHPSERGSGTVKRASERAHPIRAQEMEHPQISSPIRESASSANGRCTATVAAGLDWTRFYGCIMSKVMGGSCRSACIKCGGAVAFRGLSMLILDADCRECARCAGLDVVATCIRDSWTKDEPKQTPPPQQQPPSITLPGTKPQQNPPQNPNPIWPPITWPVVPNWWP